MSARATGIVAAGIVATGIVVTDIVVTEIDAARHGLDAARGDRAETLAALRSFHTLDALRGVAAIVVLLYHTAFIYGISTPAEGQMAVDLFFVMSGFIIAYRYEADLRAGMGVSRFLAVRLVRLYPLFLLGTVLGVIPAIVAVASHANAAFYGRLIASFPLAVLMLPSHFPAPTIEELYPLNYVSWSLVLELLVNLAYAASARVWSVRSLVVAVGLGFGALAAAAAVWGNLDMGYEWPHAAGGFARVLFGFPAGVLLFHLYRRGSLPKLAAPWWGPIVLAALLFFVPPVGDRAIWEFVGCSVVVPLIVVLAVTCEPPARLRGACATVGVFSYVLYSLHAPLIGFFLRGEDRMHLDVHVQTPVEAIAFSGFLILSCAAAHWLYDKPVRRRLTRLLDERGRREGREQRVASAKN